MRKHFLIAALATTLFVTLRAQSPEPKPAFAGQTDQPAPSTPSPALNIETITTRLNGPWSIAFLPDGNFLATEGTGTMRIVRRDGVVSTPIAGVPPVKVVAAQGLHDVLLDPAFAQNRLLYFTYFAPPRGEAAAIWPTEYFYEKVWTRPFAERRTMDVGTERVARAR
jgi:glucose/arabinose dehydrogenase